MIVITTSGIKSKASERIMSPAVACLVVRATPQSSQTGASTDRAPLPGRASSQFR
jgi:hypothetical protein